METTYRKKRSVLLHLTEIKFDFNQYVDKAFRSFFIEFLPIETCFDLLMVFITEGTKSLFRFAYSILKVYKGPIKLIKDPNNFITELSELCHKAP